MSNQLEQYKKIVNKSRHDIVWFVEKLIIEPYNKGVNENHFITRQQKKGLLELQKLVLDKIKGERREILGISIQSGKGTGKDAMASWSILWFMYCFPFPKIPCISISASQLETVLWSEISKWLYHSPIKDVFVLQTDKLFRKDVDEDVRGKRWFAFKKAANPKMAPNEQVENLQGIHEKYLLQVVDEGSGVLDPVFEALEKNMTDICNLILLIFNPMHTSGYAVETQLNRRQDWVCLNWNAEDSEIVDQSRNKKLEERFGRNSNTYRMNVLGLPPLFDDETLINWDWVMSAIDKKLVIPNELPKVMSVDCGAGGDSSIIAIRKGNKIEGFKRLKTSDSMQLANWVGNYIDEEKPDCVRVDTIGIGWAVEGLLREKKGGIVEAADVRRNADNPEKFANKRAEMYWTLRELFEKGLIEIPNDLELLDQIGATRYEFDNKGRIIIQTKKQIKAELGRSPDEFDALALLYFYEDKMISKKTVNYVNLAIKRYGWMSA